MRLLFIVILSTLGTSPVYAFEFHELFERASEKLEVLLGNKKEIKDLITLPRIPELKNNATSISVYNKNANIFKQGQRFSRLSLEEKRKFRVAFLEELSVVTRNEKMSNEKMISLLNVLEQGGTREGVYRSLVLDQVYLGLEAFEEAPSEELLNFTIKYGEVYLRRKFSRDSLKKLNLWSIKRIISEKTLELIDALAPKEIDIYRWYAVFSEDVAINYPFLWKSKLRSSKIKLKHYKWAQNVPFQHIKSEIIIKLHTTMNYVQKTN